MSEDEALFRGAATHGFVVESLDQVPELRALVYRLRHGVSEARLVHMAVDDQENLFSITIPTPPWNDTGAPHILEHSVLGGSRKYPVRQPFFEMLKMSMGTYINAFTASDHTCYPVASTVRADLFHLADVYFDAVFHPSLTEDTFRREGHRLTPLDPNAPGGALSVTGIVYNEMKGAFSRPETRLHMEAQAALLPDTPYARSSGGRPEAIPALSYEELLEFYRVHYHPSRAYFFTYGDIPVSDIAAFLDERLEGFAPLGPLGPVPRQRRWSAPRQQVREYAVDPSEGQAARTYLLVQWLAGDAADPRDAVDIDVLSLVLLGNEAAPLRRALVDSRLGQAVTMAGFYGIGPEGVFQVGLKGSEPDRAGALLDLIHDVLADLATRGLSEADVEAAFRQAAYEHLEIGSAHPLHMRRTVVEGWRLAGSPLTFLAQGQELARCRQRWREDPGMFPRLIRERLLGNPHRLCTVLRPSITWQAEADEAFRERMRQVRATLDDAQLAELAAASAEVERRAGTPNPPEAVALLPQLRLEQVPRGPRHIPTSVEQLAPNVVLLRNDVFANGVNYLALDLDVGGLPTEAWAYVPLWVDAVRKMGAAGLDYQAMARRVAAATGGVQAWPVVSAPSVAGGPGARSLRLAVKALDEQVPGALEVLGDLLVAVDPTDRERLAAVLEQAVAGMRTGLLNGGSATAWRHAAAGLDPAGELRERMYGSSQLRLLAALGRDPEHLDELAARILRVRASLVGGGRLVASFTGSDAVADAVRGALRRWGRALAAVPAPRAEEIPGSERAPRQGLAAPLAVAYIAAVMPAPHWEDPDSALVSVGAQLVTTEYVRPEIRFKGTAYGGSCAYDALGRQLALLSWQDPHVTRTLGVFAQTRHYVAGAEWSQTDVDRAIIATIKDGDRPIRPEEATTLALHRHLAGITPEARDARHQTMLGSTPAAVRQALLAVLDQGAAATRMAVMAGRGMLADANRELGAAALEVRELLPPGR